jgi:aminomethyltransferase
MTTDTLLKRTPLYEKHAALGAKIVPFAGYEMPVQYAQGITVEHKAVREHCGLFDVSHMGEFMIRGARAVDFVNFVTTNDVAALAVGQVHYSTILNDHGTIEDDCLVYRFADHVMMVVNASNIAKDFAHIARHADRFGVTLEDVSDDMGLLALQGPEAARILQPLTKTDLSTIKYYHFAEGEVAGMPMIISRTGYTGEDGFELYHDVKYSTRLWDALMAAGNVTPAGLGARDTLRLEMGMALYGMTSTTPSRPSRPTWRGW